MSVLSHLNQTASKAVLLTSENTSISTSISTLQTRLNSYFGTGVKEQFQFGSSTRGTILPRSIDSKSDIDYMVVFDESDYRPQTYLDRLRRFAVAKYATSEIFQSSPTIVLNLNHIRFELVPAIARQFTGYEIPAPASGYIDWIATFPNAFNAELRDANILHSYSVKPMVRLVKYWNAHRGYVFDSYLLEQHLVSRLSWQPSLKEYFYSAFDGLTLAWGSAQWREDRLNYAKRVIESTRQYEFDNMPYTAEAEIKKLIPEI